uniref:Coenzyme Q-binding protein COQ10 START domain-containing protein n=1 Tax=Dunaliella tertiolecta TaxID=3047 RepID=A0A7S3VNW9_DUNTE|mmetsp:Transcript_7226/g.19372  ORF Transcript_7226/g.19372 Transcript_7226/m.19372 type:complete len:239 (+) Transcript_7226:34-750(+)
MLSATRCLPSPRLQTASHTLPKDLLYRDLSSQICRSSQMGETSVSEVKKKRTAKLVASKQEFRDVPEKQKPLSSYMQLPASQYSVLDGRKVERISETTFKCYVGQLKFLSWSAEPVVTLSVDVEPLGCTIKLLSTELRGSPFVQDLNSRFEAQMTNQVRYRDGSAPNIKQITSNSFLEVELEVPGWCSFIPNSQIEGVGSSVLQNVLNLSVPRFLAQLEKDYELWSSGDTSRKPVGEL